MKYANIITNFIIKSNDKYDLCYFKKKMFELIFLLLLTEFKIM